MNEVVMVPADEFEHLQWYYKGKMTENALLNKAGRVAAQEHLILKDKRIPASMAVKMTKPLALEEGKLLKRIRTGVTGTPTYQGTAEPKGMVDAPLETLLKQIIKQEPSTPSAPDLKKKRKVSKPPIPPKPSTSKTSKRSVKKAPVSETTQGVLKSLGIDYDDGGYSPKGKAKAYKKTKKTTAEKLQEGWEDFDEPWRRGLNYEDSD